MNNFPLLKLNAEKNFLSVIVSFVENCCSSFNFTKKESRILTMASEEIFSYLCKINRGCEISVACNSKKYSMELLLQFDSKNFNPRAFNITSKINIDDEKSLDEMGLLISSRMADSFSMRKENNSILISVMKYRSYENITKLDYTPKNLTETKIVVPENQDVLLIATLIEKYEKQENLHEVFKHSAMLTDIVSSGDMHARVLKGKNGLIAGGIFWKHIGNDTIEMFGPYIYEQNNSEKFSKQLVENCLENIGKENHNGLLCRYPGKFFPEEYFEIIGNYYGNNIYYRELLEDVGTISWIHPELKEYISSQYSKLFLPREIITISNIDETDNEYSVLSSGLNRSTKMVILKPMIFGKDFKTNLKEHINLFKSENYNHVFFEIDMGQNWHSLFIPELLANDFTPSFILPYGGKGDLLVLQYICNKKEEE